MDAMFAVSTTASHEQDKEKRRLDAEYAFYTIDIPRLTVYPYGRSRSFCGYDNHFLVPGSVNRLEFQYDKVQQSVVI